MIYIFYLKNHVFPITDADFKQLKFLDEQFMWWKIIEKCFCVFIEPLNDNFSHATGDFFITDCESLGLREK